MLEVLPEGIDINDVEIQFQDEARFGQQGSITRIWAPKGSRPQVIRQGQFISANIFGSVCPDRDFGFALILPDKDTAMMQLFLDELSLTIPTGKHAVLVSDQASWHKTTKLKTPQNISLLFLPPYSPELNPIEQLWRQLKHGWLANRCFEDYDDIVNVASRAWNEFVATSGAIKRLCSRGWATLEC